MGEYIEGEKTLKDLFVSDFWPLVVEKIQNCELLTESTKATNPDELVRLEYNLKRGDRVKVYREFIWAFNKNWIEVNITELAYFLAKNTNLTTSPDIQTRSETIRRLYNNYNKKFT